MTTRIEKTDAEKLNALGAEYKFSHRGGVTGPNAVECKIIDKGTGEVWATANGANEPEAFAAAIKKAVPGDKPLTKAEMAEKIKAQEEELAQLRKNQKAGSKAPANK